MPWGFAVQWLYGIRLVAYLLILWAIFVKNRRTVDPAEPPATRPSEALEP